MHSTHLQIRNCEMNKVKDVAPFLKNLRKMLDVESSSILRWTPDGSAFEIHDMERMMHYVLPKYFKHRKYTSFQRQLNYFNFKKWTKSKAVVCTFSNDYFLRDHPDLAWRITRKKSAQLGSYKHMATRKLATAMCTLTTVSVGHPDVHHTEPIWKTEEMSIRAPQYNSEYTTESIQSPNDVDFILPTPYNAYQGLQPLADGDVDWIESLLPLYMPKQEEHLYTDNFSTNQMRTNAYTYSSIDYNTNL